MAEERRVRCPENQGLAAYVLQKKREQAATSKGLSENLERTFVKAYRNICDAKDSIKTPKDLLQIKGVGKWMLTQMKGYFVTGAESSEQEDLPNIRSGKKAIGKKRYLPQRNSVSYALLITLHRKNPNEKDFMRKQELIDAADASGLSHAPVGPEIGKGKAGLGHSKRELYSGWSSMSTLIGKGLVEKSSNPAKYMLTPEGREVANECIIRSGLTNSIDLLSDDEMDPAPEANETPNPNPTCSFTMLTAEGREVANECILRSGSTNSVDLLSDDEMDPAPQAKETPNPNPTSSFTMLTAEGREVANECIVLSGSTKSVDLLSDDEMDPAPQAKETPIQNPTCSFTIREEPYTAPRSRTQSAIPSDILEKLAPYGYSKEQVTAAFREVSDGSEDKYEAKLWPSVLCHLREADIYNSCPDSRKRRQHSAEPSTAQTRQIDIEGSRAKKFRSCNDGYTLNPCSSGSSYAVKACSASVASDGTKGITNIPRLPPLEYGQTFKEAYDVILILDDREKFATKGSRSRTIVDNICSIFKIKIEVRRLTVGDCIWIARHKYDESEFVLDFIAERKNVDDMRSSIKDNRYRDQKLRLQRSGIKKLIYILEGDPNSCDAADSIKTACLTTEILEGFDVLRTKGLGETLRKYGHLTKSIYQYYKSQANHNDQEKVTGLCPSFDSFVKRCQDLDKLTISDLFGIQLMQVPQVTEEIALAVLDMYPTLFSLASAYSELDGNVTEQEDMLRDRSNNVICASASKNIFKLVWSE